MVERQIIIALITDTEYLVQVRPMWQNELMASSAAKRIAGWCWEYYDKYFQAPGKAIETIYYDKVKTENIPVELAEEFEQDILPGLSEEYTTEPVNAEYMLQVTEKYFKSQSMSSLVNAVSVLVSKGKIDKAERLIEEYQPITYKIPPSLNDHILTARQIRKKGHSLPQLLMYPWMREGQLTILYGDYGSGKSLLSIVVAYTLGLEYDTKDSEIGPWYVENPAGTLYVDGELGQHDMQARIKNFEWLGKQKHRMRVLSIPEYQLELEDQFYLAQSQNQKAIIDWLRKHPTYKLVVLDSVSTLFGLENENDNSEWNNKVNPFLRSLRALGVACLLLHHSGKSDKKGLRGASAMGAMAHNIFRLTSIKNKDIDKGEAKFMLTKDKQRGAGFSFKSFGLRMWLTPSTGKTKWRVIDEHGNQV